MKAAAGAALLTLALEAAALPATGVPATAASAGVGAESGAGVGAEPGPGVGSAPGGEGDAAAERQRSFLALLRTYPERAPAESFALTARLVEAGPFAERARAEFWMGSAKLSLGDLGGARLWFARLARDYPGSPWTERSQLGLAAAFVREERYGEAIALYARAEGARDGAVREIAQLSRRQVLVSRARQIQAWAAAVFACGVALWLLVSIARLRPPARPLPAELRIAGPVLAVLALLALRQDPAPRAAVLEVSGAGAVYAALSGLRLRALPPGLSPRALHLSLVLAAFFACVYVAAYQNDLVGTVLETLRAGPG